MLKIIDRDIHITKGDTGYIDVLIKTSNGREYKYHEGDTLTITVKYPLSNELVFTKKIKANEIITILPTDTKLVPTGRYKYDIQLTTSLDEIFTIVPISDFFVEQEVTE